MKKFLIFIILVVCTGGAVFLSMKEVPAPDHRISKVVSNDRFLK